MLDFIKISIVALVGVLSLQLSVCGQAEKRKTDAEERELSGAVHTVRISRKLISSADGEKEIGSGWIPSVSVFTPNGSLETFEAFDDNGEYQYKTVARFDSSGRKIEEIEIKADGKRSRRRTFSYDERGNEIEMTDYYGEDGASSNTFRRAFDDKGQETAVIELDDKNNIVSTARVSRIGNYQTSDYYNAAGEFVSRSTHVFGKGENERQNVEEDTNLDENRKISSRFLTATDEKGDVTETELDADGKIVAKTAYRYERDERGNWIKETESDWTNDNNRLLLKRKTETTRKITYF